LLGKPEGKRSLGRPRCRWDIKMDFRKTGLGRGLQTELVWLRIETSGML
jgi:hypothetical protein